MAKSTTSHRYSFARKWSIQRRQPLDLWAEDKARAAHEAGSAYTVIVGNMDKPIAFIEFWDSAVGVSFLDDNGRIFLDYTFQKTHPTELFLSMATYRRFEGATDKVISGDTYVFKSEGTAFVREDDVLKKLRKESKRTVDVSANWEKYPEFGNYDSLLRIERSPTLIG